MTRWRGLWLSLAAVALLLLLGRAFAGAYAEYRWYAALGASDAWRLRFGSGALLRLIAFTAGSAIAFANLWAVRHSVVSLVLPRRLANIEIGEEVSRGTLLAIVVAVAVILGGLFALPASDWRGFELARGGVPFQETDPYFNMEIGFYVYWLPFERSVYSWVVGVVAIMCAIVVALYALTPSLRWHRGRIHVSVYVRRHIAVLGGAVLALLAWSFRLDAYATLTHGAGPDGAFGAFDHQMGVPIAIVLSYAAIGSAFVVAWAGWTGQSRIAVAVMTVLLLLTPTMQYVLPLAVRWASAPVDPAMREIPYSANRAGYTRRAFGVDRIGTFGTGDALRSARDAAGVTVWDPKPLTRALERTRRRGGIVGAPSLAMTPAGPALIAVEESPAPGESSPGNWTLLRSLAAITDERGSLVRVDADGRYPLEDEVIEPVLVYEGARGVLVVADTAGHIAAPLMESFGARLAEAWSQQNFRLLSSPTTGARMVRRRDVRDRLRAILPFFSQSTRIVPLVRGGSLFWAVELYSTTHDYPLSRRFVVTDGEVSYLHHAATALVEAHTGRVTVVLDENPDPIAQTWMRRLPVTLGRAEGAAPSLIALLPPDVDGSEVQAEAFAAVGMRGEGYVRRHFPALDGSDSLVTSHAQTFVWLPTVGTAWVVPLVDDRERVSGVLVSTGGPSRSLRWFRLADTSMNWNALLERLQHAADAEEGRTREPLDAGRVRLLPLADGRLLALQPFYGWPADGAPYVSRVAMALGDSARSAASVAAAVGAPVTSGPAPATPDAKQERMRTLYAEMRSALQRGDWRAFGAAFDALGGLLGRQ